MLHQVHTDLLTVGDVEARSYEYARSFCVLHALLSTSCRPLMFTMAAWSGRRRFWFGVARTSASSCKSKASSSISVMRGVARGRTVPKGPCLYYEVAKLAPRLFLSFCIFVSRVFGYCNEVLEVRQDHIRRVQSAWSTVPMGSITVSRFLASLR